MKILVVDDELLVCECMKSMLCNEGHEVETAESGEEALSKFDSHRFDLVFTDYAMPGIQGDELARTIGGLPQPPPVVMITGQPPEHTPPAVVKVVLKPFDTKKLRRVVFELSSRKVDNN